MFKRIISVLFLAVFAAGCAGALQKGEVDAHFYFDRGMNYFNKRDYVKALTEFQTITEQFQASEIVDQAHFMLAETHYKNEDYITAAYEYERVYADYPTSKYAVEARYKRALCYYQESPKADLDQENTRTAIDDFKRFIDNFPDNEFVNEAQKKINELEEKLAYKNFKTGELYVKLKRYESAVLYFKFLQDDYPKSVWVKEAKYYIGEIYFKQKKYAEAKQVLTSLVSSDADKNLKKKAEKKLSQIEKITRKNTKK